MGNNTLSTVNGESNGAPGSVNNGSAVSAAHTLTNNQNMLSKSLGMVSSGLRIRSAADGASEYAIGERMKIQVRGLEQDIRNVKNGGDLVKIAEGGIQNIVDNLRDMKRMALDAANDTNT
ncbi:MAG: flagellin, partial [Schwartzia sp.]|nr:flagellin [Schwartzia sp. (in: firmicutes)]